MVKTSEQWLAEVQQVYEIAKKEFDKHFKDKGIEMTELYRLAPSIAAVTMEIRDKSVVESIEEKVFADLENDFAKNPDIRSRYQFNFVLTYIYSWVYGDKLSRAMAAKILDYINEQWDLMANS